MRVWICGSILALLLAASSADAWTIETVGKRARPLAPVVAGGERSDRAAVAWWGRSFMQVRLRDRAGRWGPIESVRGSASLIGEPPQMALVPGRVVLAWQDVDLNAAQECPETYCAFWRVAQRVNGTWQPTQALSSPTSLSFKLYLRFDRKGRAWVAWEEDTQRFFVARIARSGEIVDRRRVGGRFRSYSDLLGLHIRRGRPVVTVKEGASRTTSVLELEVGSAATWSRVLVTADNVNSQVESAVSDHGPDAFLWDPNAVRTLVFAAARGAGGEFGAPQRILRAPKGLTD